MLAVRLCNVFVFMTRQFILVCVLTMVIFIQGTRNDETQNEHITVIIMNNFKTLKSQKNICYTEQLGTFTL